jgi:hypothetical protein
VNTPWSAFVIDAETTLDIWLNASDSPIATDTPASPPTDPASEAAPATALITEESCAPSVTLVAVIPPVNGSAPSPMMPAVTSVLILFSV